MYTVEELANYISLEDIPSAWKNCFAEIKNSYNIIKFQDKFSIIEYEENINDFLSFVFDVIIGEVEYKDLPEKTILQKELKRKLLNNETLHLGLGFVKGGIL